MEESKRCVKVSHTMGDDHFISEGWTTVWPVRIGCKTMGDRVHIHLDPLELEISKDIMDTLCKKYIEDRIVESEPQAEVKH